MKKITFILSFLTCTFSFSQSTANYDISVTTIWNTTDHTSVPESAHWSPLAGATHKTANTILEFGTSAPTTNGIKNIAETGNTSAFSSEISALITSGEANQYLQQGFAPFAGNASTSNINSITVNEDFPLITLVSMVAPSPDWFIAINSLDLKSGDPSINNGWRDTFTIDVFAYDSGTDSGTDYTSGNAVTSPRTSISMVSGFPINGNRMATVTFTFNSSTLGSENLNTLEGISIFPNPVTDKLTISNLNNINLESIEIFTVLGNLNRKILIKDVITTIQVDTSNLTSGIYLLKLNNEAGDSKTQKLIVQ
ncbi:spondin domain-containing protein [Hyunsoonleella sp. 2307UL5-6]|uniref:T9SS type A sorting domain-containing protein n=1 Tax=Hyunsoonleella sp. 2307UL5-6 TaxID=3384768 RepID=UPI0039BD3067